MKSPLKMGNDVCHQDEMLKTPHRRNLPCNSDQLSQVITNYDITPRNQCNTNEPVAVNDSPLQEACKSNTESKEYSPLSAAHLMNPFESRLLDRLENPSVFSPSIFTKTSTPEQKSFHWSIDHLSLLRPVPIEQNKIPTNHDHDHELEEKAQKAIDSFFRNHSIVPSPWGSKQTHNVFERAERCLSEEIGTQTILSFPTDLDVNKIFADFVCTSTSSTESLSESFGNTSLRRKLSFVPNTCDDPLVPDVMRSVSCSSGLSPSDDSPSRPMAFPLSSVTVFRETQFSSSPLEQVPLSLRRCSASSELPQFSPELSPISTGCVKRNHSANSMEVLLQDTPSSRPPNPKKYFMNSHATGQGVVRKSNRPVRRKELRQNFVEHISEGQRPNEESSTMHAEPHVKVQEMELNEVEMSLPNEGYDTGYQTIQSQISQSNVGDCRTNLTSQFESLPLDDNTNNVLLNYCSNPFDVRNSAAIS